MTVLVKRVTWLQVPHDRSGRNGTADVPPWTRAEVLEWVSRDVARLRAVTPRPDFLPPACNVYANLKDLEDADEVHPDVTTRSLPAGELLPEAAEGAEYAGRLGRVPVQVLI